MWKFFLKSCLQKNLKLNTIQICFCQWKRSINIHQLLDRVIVCFQTNENILEANKYDKSQSLVCLLRPEEWSLLELTISNAKGL